MNERKRAHLSHNTKTLHKATFPQTNYTQQFDIPQTQFRQAASFQIIKNGIKSQSRKSRSISVRQPVNGMSLNINQLLKKFKSMKLIQERVKSPHGSIKLKGKGRKNTKLMTEGKSIGRDPMGDLAIKVERTLQKLKQNYAVKFEDDLDIPFRSESQMCSKQEKKRIPFEVEEVDDDINIEELRHFCKSEEPGIHVSLDYLKTNTFEVMAKRIQRWWRRQKTQRLIKRYISKISDNSPFESFGFSNEQNGSKVKMVQTSQMQMNQFDEQQKEEQEGETFHFQESCINEVEEGQFVEKDWIQDEQLDHSKLRQIQKEQLAKWSQIVMLMSENKVESKQDIEVLYKEIISRSKLYKQKLEINSHRSNGYDNDQVTVPQCKQNVESATKLQHQAIQNRTDNASLEILTIQQFKEKERKWRGLNKEECLSEDSIKQISQQFNAKKYVEYYDSEKYPVHSAKKSSSTINQTAQKELLLKLNDPNSVKKTGRTNKMIFDQILEIAKSRLSNHTKSGLSLKNIVASDKLQIPHQTFVRQSKKLKHQIRKSVSDKAMKYCSLQGFESLAKIKQNESMSLVEEQIPLIFSIDEQKQRKKAFQKQYQQFLFHEIGKDVEENLRSLIKKQILSNSSSEFSQPSQLGGNCEEDMDQFCIDEVSNERSESKQSTQRLQSLDSKQNFTNLEIANQPQKNKQETPSSNDASVKGGQVAQQLGEALLIQFLVEMGKYGNAFFKLKALLSAKNKPRTMNRTRYGFLTDENEIMQFIRELSLNVLNQQPQIFKNFEISTEPSALEMLRYMHEQICEQAFEDFEQDDATVMVLPNRIFQNFWSKKSQQLKYEKKGIEESLELRRQEYLKGLNKIFMRSCFDSFNDCLDYERNYGPFGKPFPWKKSQVFSHTKNYESILESVTRSQNRLFEVCSTNCGNLDDCEFAQQEKLSNMLAKDVIENEERWIFYDDQETELLVQASHLLFDGLLEEFKCQVLDNNSSNFFF